jgi:hypothetical protein
MRRSLYARLAGLENVRKAASLSESEHTEVLQFVSAKNGRPSESPTSG